MRTVGAADRIKAEASTSLNLGGLVLGVEGGIADDHPKLFTSMHIIYEFRGDDLPLDKLSRAIELSQDKYCGVNASLKKAMPVTWEIRLL